MPVSGVALGDSAPGDSLETSAPIPLGRVTEAWGIRGWVKVEPYAAASDTTLTRAPRWYLSYAPAVRRAALGPTADRSPDRGLASSRIAPAEGWVSLERARRHSAGVVAKLKGIDDRESAQALKGLEVGVLRADFPALPEGEFYWVDLIGCALVNAQGESLGTVSSMDDHGAHPLLQTDTGVIVPFVDAYLIEVAPEARRIVVDWQADWSR